MTFCGRRPKVRLPLPPDAALCYNVGHGAIIVGQTAMPPEGSEATLTARVSATMATAADIGLTDGRKDRQLSGRAPERLVQAAMEKSGLAGSALLEYALAKVALEDTFVETLLALEGAVPADIDLEF